MCNTAAHLTDRVLPDVPIRQWVLSLPFDLRIAAAPDPELLAACDRALVDAVFRWMRGRLGLARADRRVDPAATAPVPALPRVAGTGLEVEE